MSEQAHSIITDQGHSDHIVPFWLLAAIGGILMVMTYFTVVIAGIDLGAEQTAKEKNFRG